MHFVKICVCMVTCVQFTVKLSLLSWSENTKCLEEISRMSIQVSDIGNYIFWLFSVMTFLVSVMKMVVLFSFWGSIIWQGERKKKTRLLIILVILKRMYQNQERLLIHICELLLCVTEWTELGIWLGLKWVGHTPAYIYRAQLSVLLRLNF